LVSGLRASATDWDDELPIYYLRRIKSATPPAIYSIGEFIMPPNAFVAPPKRLVALLPSTLRTPVSFDAAVDPKANEPNGMTVAPTLIVD